MTNPLVSLGRLGQSPWYDYITRDLMRSGELARLIAEDGLLGMTSNPTIFEKAIAGSDLYDEEIRRQSGEGRPAAEIFETLAVTDVQAACDAFKTVYERTGGGDGLVSLEVSPTLAHDTRGTINEAERLWGAVGRANAMIKIPGTLEGLPAISHCLAAGINVNVTLLFSVERYQQVIDAFMAGLERRVAQNAPIDRVQSVASFFVSRLDGKVDAQLDASGQAPALRSKAAIANACAAYAAFETSIASPRWKSLLTRGARVQRPLWASTSTKDPKLPDVYYVEALIAEHTVNTLPPATFSAYRDHGKPQLRIRDGVAAAAAQLQGLAEAGIDLAAVTSQLEKEGVASFAASFASLLAVIEKKGAVLVG